MKLSDNRLTVFDEKTGLTWQQGGSDEYMVCADAEKYIQKLNAEHFAGHNDWRLPTRDEAMSILTLQPAEDNFFCNPVFDRGHRYIWTADKDGAMRAWSVDFYFGSCGRHNDESYVRAVRS